MLKNIIAAALVFALLGAMAYAALFIAPTDAKQGLVYRILYLHVSSAWTGLTAFLIGFLANLLYVWRRQARWDWLGVSAVEVGLAYTSVVLVTGPIWGHPVWGIWWTWDARLTSTFVMWLLYVSYLLLRTLVEEPDRCALLSELYGTFAFLDVPLVFGSIRWWRTQHPQPIVMGGADSGMDPMMYRVLMFSWFAMLALMTLLLRQRYRLEATRSDLETMRHELESV
jgi:heme exporter protein C